MVIDWFTVSAQVLNFLVLAWLLKRFLYKPILNAIDAREKRIAEELADAATQQAEAQKERDEFQAKNEAFDLQRGDLLSQVRDEVNVERQRLLEEARKVADALHTKRQNALNREQQNLNDEIIKRTREEVYAVAEKTLIDLAGVKLEVRMIDVFSRRLRELKGEQKEGLIQILKTSAGPVLVRSAFDLPAEQRAAIHQAINEIVLTDVHIRFETAPSVISGIELIANGQKIAWSVAEHLASLGKSVRELLQEQPKPQAKAEKRVGNELETTLQKV